MTHPYDILNIPQGRGQLIFTPCPGTRDASLAEALTVLKAAGANALITLMPDAELAANHATDLPNNAQSMASSGCICQSLRSKCRWTTSMQPGPATVNRLCRCSLITLRWPFTVRAAQGVPG